MTSIIYETKTETTIDKLVSIMPKIKVNDIQICMHACVHGLVEEMEKVIHVLLDFLTES